MRRVCGEAGLSAPTFKPDDACNSFALAQLPVGGRLILASALTSADLERLHACLRPGDVLLVEGDSRISTAVKYLTQSTWSYAALYVGPRPDLCQLNGTPRWFVEADTVHGAGWVRRGWSL